MSTIHPDVIMADYHSFRERMCNKNSDPDELQKLFESLFAASLLACSFRRHPDATDGQIDTITNAMQALMVEWSHRYSYMVVRKVFGINPT